MRKNVFGLDIQYDTWNHKDDLPHYLINTYTFYQAIIGEEKCLILVPKDSFPTISALIKQIQKIHNIENVPVVFMFPSISPYRRKSFIENRISFITDRQAFLPFLGTYLMNEASWNMNLEHFTFSTQEVFLYYLYQNQERLYVSEIGKQLSLSAMTLTRAVRQLEATGLFEAFKDGVRKWIQAKEDRYTLFKKVKPYLLSPVRCSGYIDKTEITEELVIAGETALAEKSMMNPSKCLTYAVQKNKFDKNKLEKELIDPNTQVRLELWAYDPMLFSDDSMADILSVILSLKYTKDERIEQAIVEVEERLLK